MSMFKELLVSNQALREELAQLTKENSHTLIEYRTLMVIFLLSQAENQDLREALYKMNENKPQLLAGLSRDSNYTDQETGLRESGLIQTFREFKPTLLDSNQHLSNTLPAGEKMFDPFEIAEELRSKSIKRQSDKGTLDSFYKAQTSSKAKDHFSHSVDSKPGSFSSQRSQRNEAMLTTEVKQGIPFPSLRPKELNLPSTARKQQAPQRFRLAPKKGKPVVSEAFTLF